MSNKQTKTVHESVGDALFSDVPPETPDLADVLTRKPKKAPKLEPTDR